MTFDTGTNSRWDSDDDDRPVRLSQSGHMIGWAAFGSLVLVGFFFGIVTGYETPRPKPRPAKEIVKAEPSTPTPKVNPQPPATPAEKSEEPKVEPPKVDPPKVDPPKVDPPKVDPPKVDPPKIDNPRPKTPAVAAVSFQKDVLPIFRTYCLNCHGNGSGKLKGDVDLRTIASIMKGGGGPIIEVGKPEKSSIYTTIMDNSMPPEGKRPGIGEREVIREWILGGARP